MSNRKLEVTAGKYGAAKYPRNLDYFQPLYETRRHRAHPVTVERLEEFSIDLKIIAHGGEDRVKFYPEFVTDDGTKWIGVRLRYVTGNKFIFAFPKDEDPKHRDGTVSAQHVALFCNDDEVSDEELENAAQAAHAIFYTYRH